MGSVVLFVPVDEPWEETLVLQPALTDYEEVLVVGDEDAAFLYRVVEEDIVVSALGESVDGALHVPALGEEPLHHRLLDVVVGKDREAAGHYRARRCLRRCACSRRTRATSFRPSRIDVSISSGWS
jgi:hypothetical protein